MRLPIENSKKMLVLISFPRHSFCAHRYTSCNQFYTPAFYQTRQILLASSSMRRMAFGYSGVGKENQFQAVSNLHTTGTCTELYCMITYRSLTMREDKERGGGNKEGGKQGVPKVDLAPNGRMVHLLTRPCLNNF
jgi:hypothetical protein